MLTSKGTSGFDNTLKDQHQQRQQQKKNQPVLEFSMAAFATSMACILSNPMEVVKTRMQLQGELMLRTSKAGQGGYQKPYRNFADAFLKICRDEGLKGIQAGLLPGVLYQTLMNGTRLSLFGPVSAAFGADRKKNGGASFFFRNLAAGAACGACGAVVGSPLFLIKARLQSQSTAHSLRAPGTGQFEYRGMWHAITDVVRREGLLGMTRGMSASVTRVMIGSAAQLSSYSSCKAAVLHTGLFEDNIYAYLASSMVAGLAITTAMNPFDVASTRLYTQGGGVTERYSGMLDCASKTLRTEGPRGPHTIFTFLFWEEIKKLAVRLELHNP